MPLLPRVDLLHFLDDEPVANDWEDLPTRYKLHVLTQQEVFEKRRVAMEPLPMCGVIDASRDPQRGMDSNVGFGHAWTLRTNNSHLWVLPSPETASVLGEHGRFLKLSEKKRIMGVVAGHLDSLSQSDAEIALGNTIAAPQAALAMAPMLKAFQLMLRSEALALPSP